MSDYIKREDAERLLRYDFLSALTDVVEVVRCKDCKYRKSVPNVSYGQCIYMATMVDNDDFCSYGEEREHE